jgi:hypothetical protein
MNFLEQLASEWYAYNNYFVRTNIKYGYRNKGGFVGEIDVAAYKPKENLLVHVEASMDDDTWEERKERMSEKFNKARPYYTDIFKFDIVMIERIAIAGYSWGEANPSYFGDDIKLVLVPDFIRKVTQKMSEYTPVQKKIPGESGLLRAIQFTAAYGLDR